MNLWASAEMQTNAHQKPREIQKIQKIQNCRPHVCAKQCICEHLPRTEVQNNESVSICWNANQCTPETSRNPKNPKNPKLQAPWTIHQTSGLQTWGVQFWIFWKTQGFWHASARIAKHLFSHVSHIFFIYSVWALASFTFSLALLSECY